MSKKLTPIPRTIQEIFNAVIDEGFYSNEFIESKSSRWMCEAIHYAYVAELLTMEERRLALEEIKEYIQGYTFLGSALSISNLPYKYEDRLAIYRNWANRPQLTYL